MHKIEKLCVLVQVLRLGSSVAACLSSSPTSSCRTCASDATSSTAFRGLCSGSRFDHRKPHAKARSSRQVDSPCCDAIFLSLLVMLQHLFVEASQALTPG